MIGLVAASATLGSAIARARRRKLAGQVVLTTGGSRGFGLALADEFAKLGCRIAIYALDQDELARAQHTLGSAGHEVVIKPCDISDGNAVTAMVGRCHLP